MIHTERHRHPAAVLQFSPTELKKLKAQGLRKDFKKGEHLWAEGDESDTVYLVEKGRVNMSIQSSEGASTLVHFCTAAQSFCPAAAISGHPYLCAAQAASHVATIAVPRSVFLKLFDQLPGLAKSLFSLMAPMMCESHRSQALVSSPVKARLADLLGRLHDKYHGEELPFTRQELADMSSTTVETTIRILSAWEKAGVIQSSRGSIQIRRPETLEEACA